MYSRISVVITVLLAAVILASTLQAATVIIVSPPFNFGLRGILRR